MAKRSELAEGPRVIVVGGGFGGLEAAKALAQAPVQLTLLDRQNHHCFQPLLYQVATAALSPADIAWPIRAILRKQQNAKVLLATVTGVDKERRLVQTDSVSLPYDYLVLATGATHSYFGHDEWGTFAPRRNRKNYAAPRLRPSNHLGRSDDACGCVRCAALFRVRHCLGEEGGVKPDWS
jgi:NADH dehydrogenase FAD-containing subunit